MFDIHIKLILYDFLRIFMNSKSEKDNINHKRNNVNMASTKFINRKSLNIVTILCRPTLLFISVTQNF